MSEIGVAEKFELGYWPIVVGRIINFGMYACTYFDERKKVKIERFQFEKDMSTKNHSLNTLGNTLNESSRVSK